MPICKRLAALVLCLSLLLPSLAFSQSMVDFDYLKQLNEDCIGWLYQPESGLNQPVMQSEDDEWYHERAFDQNKVYQVGSAYMLAQDSLADNVVIIRGQAREEGCFSVISDWRDPLISSQRSPFQLLTPSGDYQAAVFACVAIETKELDSWVPGRTQSTFNAWLLQVQSASLIQTDASLWPKAGDRLLFLAGLHLNGKCTLVMARLEPAASSETKVDLVKQELDSRETLNGLVDAGPAGQLMYYAQNDPLYATMRYESGYRDGVQRDFGGGGCGPTAMAIIAANLVDKQALPILRHYGKDALGTLFCTCSVNRVYCNHTCVPYQLNTPDEYLRYLPVAMGNFAAGNNQWEFLARRSNAQGTNVRFVDYICAIYGLNMETVNGLDTALELMKEKTGEGLILASALRGSPFTNNSHFVVITGVDEEYFYVLDPLRRTREEYLKTDTRGILELLSPGVTRIRIADYGRSDLSPVCYISREEK